MNNSAQKQKPTTQKFIEISDILDNIVLFSDGNACSIIEVKAVNFTLLSRDEQNIKLLSYSSLINSLSFSIQIFIRSKRINISSYLKLLEKEVEKSQNSLLKNQINHYKDFVQDLIRANDVLDKKFYIVIPHSRLESGLGLDQKSFYLSAKAKLSTKLEGIHSMLKRNNLSARTLEKKELTALFYEIYNEYEQVNEATQDPSDSINKNSPEKPKTPEVGIQ